MIKRQKSGGENAVFYSPISNTTEVRSGYLWKSPPQKRLTTERSWKKRFFVLFKISEQEHLLKYFKSPDETDMPLGGIDLTQISVLYVSPEKHQRWNWVEKMLKCSPSRVILIKAAERDYFLVAENCDEVNGWFADLYEALKHRPHQRLSPEEMSFGPPTREAISYPVLWKKKSAFEEGPKGRSKSDPPSKPLDTNPEEPKAEDHVKRRASMPLNPNYDYPRTFRLKSQAENTTTRRKSYDEIYQSIAEMRIKARADQAAFDLQRDSDHEYEEVSTLMRSVTNVFEKLRTQITGLPAFDEETADEHRKEKRLTPDFSSSSSDNGAVSPEEMPKDQQVLRRGSSAERETNFRVKLAGLLTATEVKMKPRKERRATPSSGSSSTSNGAVCAQEIPKEIPKDPKVRRRESSAGCIKPRERSFRAELADLKQQLTATEVKMMPRKERRLTPYFGSSSTSNEAVYARELPGDRKVQTPASSTERERDVLVKQADLKKYLTLTEVDGNISVSGWTCQPQTACLFHQEDRIVGINDLLVNNLQEFNVYLSKCLKDEVKLTTRRVPGSRPLHSPDCPCSDPPENAVAHLDD